MSRALETQWLIKWLQYLGFALWQLTWYFGFKTKYNWLTFLATWWATCLAIGDIIQFCGGDDYKGTDYELSALVFRIASQIAWAILLGPMLFWGRRSDRFTAIFQAVHVGITLMVILAAIILYSVEHQSIATTVGFGFAGLNGILSGPIGFVALLLFLKDHQFKTFRAWTIVTMVAWLLPGCYVFAVTLAVDDPSMALLVTRELSSFVFFAVFNVWTFQCNEHGVLQPARLRKTEELSATADQLERAQMDSTELTPVAVNTEQEEEQKEEQKEEEEAGGQSDNATDFKNARALLDEVMQSDWTYRDSVFGKEFNFLNGLYVKITMLIGFLSLLVHLALFVVFVLTPIMMLYLSDFLLFCWLCRGKARPTLSPFAYIRRVMSDERLYLSTRNPMEIGIWWQIRNYIQVFWAGLDFFILFVRCKGNSGEAHRRLIECQRALYGGKNADYFPSASSVTTANYKVALELFSDPQQAHEFATTWTMHSVIGRFCQFYSLGQTMKTRSFEFIDDLHWALNDRAKDRFVANRTPKSLYKPELDSKGKIGNQAFAAVIATTYFKVFGRVLDDDALKLGVADGLKVFEQNKAGLAVVGALPAEFLKFFGDLFPSKYWKMTSLWRKLILADPEVTQIVLEKAVKHGFAQSARSLDYCINSFCVEVLPGCAGIADGVAEGMKQFRSDRGEDFKKYFRKNPEEFALECLRMEGAPYGARTVMRAYDEIEVEGKTVSLFRNNCILTDIATTSRCPFKFGPDPNAFDPKRENLLTDPYVFGSTERLIRSGKAVKQCPVHDFAIMMVQETLARIAGLDVDVEYNGQKYKGSYELKSE